MLLFQIFPFVAHESIFLEDDKNILPYAIMFAPWRLKIMQNMKNKVRLKKDNTGEQKIPFSWI